MRILPPQDFLAEVISSTEKIRQGAVFIYPTDTIYGIGCDATNEAAVQKIRQLKGRMDKPFSVIAPSEAWIRKYCVINDESWLRRLGEGITLILALKKGRINAVAPAVIAGSRNLGVRIPKHWISKFVSDYGKPIVTTSVNPAGMAYMTSKERGDPHILALVDFIIDEGEKTGRPSTIVDITGKEVKMIQR
ncbi:threonylcarbamoyl-AMP synthase [Candidatus Woesearchaeota archaeon]|nr:threonylcarbamoyl-AMP synthase [Candidatus Woesearchaeota archaeon]